MSFIRPVPWTRQPPGPVRLNRALGLRGNTTFLWNASIPQANQSGGFADVKGTRSVAPAGNFVNLTGITTAQSFTAPFPTARYTCFILLCFPNASASSAVIFRNSSAGGGFRIDTSTGAGSVAVGITHNAVAGGAGVNPLVSSFDYSLWTAIFTYDGTTQRGSLVHPKYGVTTNSAAIGYASAAGTTDIGSTSSGNSGLFAIALTDEYTDHGVAVAIARQNPWQLFAPITRRIWVPQSGAAPAFLGAWARGSTTIVGSGLPGG